MTDGRRRCVARRARLFHSTQARVLSVGSVRAPRRMRTPTRADADERERRRRGLRKQALAVDGEPDYSTGPPMDGFEYLRRVAFEAKQTPDIDTATHRRSERVEAGEAAVSSTREDEEIEYAPPSWATPDREWVRRTVGDFSELRVRVSRAIAGDCRLAAGRSVQRRQARVGTRMRGRNRTLTRRRARHGRRGVRTFAQVHG